MKMVKSLLLGSAAGLVAVAGAQAADLPVKAKPVEYVKICSLYGAGFYYMPGTDICLKVGGWVRAEYAWGGNGNMAWGPFNANVNNRNTNDTFFRARGYITADARQQTEYGTLRSYIAVGLSENDVGLNTAANTFSANRAFIQFAGFTFGRAQSFYDFYSTPATAYWGAYPASDTGDPGWLVGSYTAQLGNGFSATLGIETRRMTQIVNQNVASTVGAAAAFPGAFGGFRVPDVVGNIRVDQAWGSAQIMGALHQVNAGYYTTALEPSGHPDDELGWAVGGGLRLKTDFIAKGDYFQAQVNYTEGALRYVFSTPNTNWFNLSGGTAGYGVLSDAVYGGTIAGGNATSLQLTSAWGINAAYEHFWTPAWRTSLYGGYAEVMYNGQANAMICQLQGAANGAGSGTAAVAVAGCDNDWRTWWIGSRTQWNITPTFYMGVDVLYSRLESASTANNVIGTNTLPATTGVTAATTPVDDKDNVQVRFRVHRDFVP